MHQSVDTECDQCEHEEEYDDYYRYYVVFLDHVCGLCERCELKRRGGIYGLDVRCGWVFAEAYSCGGEV